MINRVIGAERSRPDKEIPVQSIRYSIDFLRSLQNPAANEAEHAVSLLLSATAPDTPSAATIRIATDAAPCTPDLSATANATYPALLSRWAAALSADETLILSDRGLPPKLRIMLR